MRQVRLRAVRKPARQANHSLQTGSPTLLRSSRFRERQERLFATSAAPPVCTHSPNTCLQLTPIQMHHPLRLHRVTLRIAKPQHQPRLKIVQQPMRLTSSEPTTLPQVLRLKPTPNRPIQRTQITTDAHSRRHALHFRHHAPEMLNQPRNEVPTETRTPRHLPNTRLTTRVSLVHVTGHVTE